MFWFYFVFVFDFYFIWFYNSLNGVFKLNAKGVQIAYDFVFPVSEQMNFQQISVEVERQEITNLVRNRLQDMGIPQEDYGLNWLIG
jgi:hypothetical protein